MCHSRSLEILIPDLLLALGFASYESRGVEPPLWAPSEDIGIKY